MASTEGDTAQMKDAGFHEPVLLREVIEFLEPRAGKLYIDATLGGGGHTFALLQHGARVLGIDRDPEAIEHVRSICSSSKSSQTRGVEKLPVNSSRQARTIRNLTLVQGNFSHLSEIAKSNDFTNVNGILFDLGVSSHQLANASRGFSFQNEGPLDMRMDPNLTVTAQDLINNFDERRLNEIFKTYAGEKFSRPIARAICSARQIGPITSTVRLAKIIRDATRGVRNYKKSRIHPATRTFQALRIVINSELINLGQSLPQTTNLLASGGRLAIISFHSLEDRQVKRFFKQQAKLKVLTPKPIGPSRQEVLENPRARSAKLRVAEKI